MWQVLRQSAGFQLDDAMRAQATLPRSLGGLSVPAWGTMSQLARIAAVMQLWPDLVGRSDPQPGPALPLADRYTLPFLGHIVARPRDQEPGTYVLGPPAPPPHSGTNKC